MIMMAALVTQGCKLGRAYLLELDLQARGLLWLTPKEGPQGCKLLVWGNMNPNEGNAIQGDASQKVLSTNPVKSLFHLCFH